MSDSEADSLFRQRRYDDAATHLTSTYKTSGDDALDSLLYVLDIGLALHYAGRYKESNDYFLKADKLAEIKDYTSISQEVATVLVTDNIKSYKVEDFENVLINVYLAINYAMLGNLEDALVEARRVNHKLYLMVSQGKRKYKQNAFARYLSAILYEMRGEWNDAYIDYKNTRGLMPEFKDIGVDLWRTAYRLRMREECDEWQEEYGLSAEALASIREGAKKVQKGELIVLYQNGISPIKQPHPNLYTIPKFYARSNPVAFASVQVDGQVVGETKIFHDVETTAIENLDEKYAGIIAKKVGGLVAKQVIGHEVGKASGNEFFGVLASAALMASDQADLRSWQTLPRDLQILRVPLDPGEHEVNISLSGSSEVFHQKVTIASGKKVLVNYRFMP